jgi:hypothetical protein
MTTIEPPHSHRRRRSGGGGASVAADMSSRDACRALHRNEWTRAVRTLER